MRSSPEDPRRAAQRFFGDKAAAYATSASHAHAADLARMVAWLALPPGARALDVATGGGPTARALAAAGARVVATDVTRAMLARLEGAAPVAADAQALPFRAGAFDAVACRIAAHHFPDVAAFAREAARVLRPGGALYVFDLATPEDAALAAEIDALERLRDPSHVHSRSPAEWRAALDAAGLATERLEASASEFDLEPWIARAAMPPKREAALRAALAARPRAARAGWGAEGGRMRVLRVELLARR